MHICPTGIAVIFPGVHCERALINALYWPNFVMVIEYGAGNDVDNDDDDDVGNSPRKYLWLNTHTHARVVDWRSMCADDGVDDDDDDVMLHENNSWLNSCGSLECFCNSQTPDRE